MTAKRTHAISLIALISKLRLAHQKLPPGKRLQLRPVTAIGKLRPPLQNPRPSKASKFIPTGKPLRHLRLGNDQPFPSPNIVLWGIGHNNMRLPAKKYFLHRQPLLTYYDITKSIIVAALLLWKYYSLHFLPLPNP